MRDVTNYPLSPNQRTEVEEYMNNHNVTETEARYMLGYVPGDIEHVTVTEALEMVKEENPNTLYAKKLMKSFLKEKIRKTKKNKNKIIGKFYQRNIKSV